jgi:hypothetical protein
MRAVVRVWEPLPWVCVCGVPELVVVAVVAATVAMEVVGMLACWY